MFCFAFVHRSKIKKKPYSKCFEISTHQSGLMAVDYIALHYFAAHGSLTVYRFMRILFCMAFIFHLFSFLLRFVRRSYKSIFKWTQKLNIELNFSFCFVYSKLFNWLFFGFISCWCIQSKLWLKEKSDLSQPEEHPFLLFLFLNLP